MTGRVTSLSITDSGFGYTTAPGITISVPDQDSANATATATVTNGSVDFNGITITDSGSYYVNIPTVTFSSPPGGHVSSASTVGGENGTGHIPQQIYQTTGGSGTGFSIRATSSGGLTSFVIINAGKNYVAGDQVQTVIADPATIKIDSISAGTTATAIATLDSNAGGRVATITPVIFGTNYDSAPTVTISAADGTAHDYRATGVAVLGDSGKIASLTITDSGGGYITAPTVTIDTVPRIVKDSASQTLSTGVKVSGEVLKYSDSDGKIYIGRTVADDGNYHEFVKDRLITLANVNDDSPISRTVLATSNEEIQSTNTEQNLDFDNVSDDFLDFSETNPFGDPED
jgi:hypothetical protein